MLSIYKKYTYSIFVCRKKGIPDNKVKIKHKTANKSQQNKLKQQKQQQTSADSNNNYGPLNTASDRTER